ncbi:MAG TPA: metallophosphoesterase [Gaiellaceae bacterium]|nr:metallophosphoesterase [Gaiellaceae bacterium]
MGLDPAYWKLQAPGGRLFADPQPDTDETAFQVDNTSAAYYDSVYYKLHRAALQPVPPPREPQPRVDLTAILGADFLAPTVAAKKVTFHAVGDTGAAKVNSRQTAAEAIANEASVVDAMSWDVRTGGPTGPAFFFHLGDVVYNFGEGQYYYDQFYEPFQGYDRPIFAIPGNHDGAVFGDDPDTPDIPTLTAFVRNFCAEAPTRSPDAGSLVRSKMTQPGVYFTLDAPFVSIVGLYTNVLEGPGVISSQGGRYPIGDEQLDFLTAELVRLAPERKAGKRAVIIACHHPPASVDSKHGGGSGLADDLDTAAKQAGFWPDAVLSGHAHVYQRYTRKTHDGREIPYVVAGSGGFAATAPQGGLPHAPLTIGEYTLVAKPLVDFGYLTVTVDLGTPQGHLTITFNDRTNTKAHDTVRLNLKTGKILKH